MTSHLEERLQKLWGRQCGLLSWLYVSAWSSLGIPLLWLWKSARKNNPTSRPQIFTWKPVAALPSWQFSSMAEGPAYALFSTWGPQVTMSTVWLGVTSESLWSFLPFLANVPQSQGSQEWTWGSERETRSLAVEICTRRQQGYLRINFKFWLVRQEPTDLCLQKTSRWWSALLSIHCSTCFNGMKRSPHLGLGIFVNDLWLSNMRMKLFSILLN